MPIRTGRIELARIFGIRVSVNTSWFFVLFLSIFFLSSNFRTVLGGSSTQAYEAAVASALLFFASLILHELGHALTARAAGIEIDGIDLWLLGGVSKMRSAPQTPAEALRIALAGPVVNLLLAVAFAVLGSAFGGGLRHFVDVALFAHGVHATVALAALSWLALMNSVIFIFNLIPAYPLDGGQIAHAIAWAITGDRNRAARAAAQLGRGFGFLLCALGVLLLLGGRGFGLMGVWLTLIGIFIAQSSRALIVRSRVSDRLRDMRVTDVMDPHPVTIPAHTQLLAAQEEYFARYSWPWFAVVDDGGRLVGVLAQARVQSELRDGRPVLTAGEVAEDGAPWRIDASATLEGALASEAIRRVGAAIAVDSDGLMRGVLTLAQVHKALASGAGV